MAKPALVVRIGANLDDLKKALSQTGLEVKASTQQLEKMARSFRGENLIASATKSVAVLKEMGTAALSTSRAHSELDKITKSIEQMHRIGQKVPDDFKQIQAELSKSLPLSDRLGRSLGISGDIFSKFKGIASSLGIGVGVGSIVSFGKQVIDTADKVGDLAAKLGLSTEAVQRFKFAAEQGGSTIDDVGTSIAFMNRTLAEGTLGTRDLLARIGLSFEKLRAQKPEETFRQMADAIKAIPDPMDRVRVTMELLGKTGVNLLPAIQDGITEVGNRTRVMSAETIKSLKEAKETWEGFWNTIVVISAEAIRGARGGWAAAAEAADKAKKAAADAKKAMDDLKPAASHSTIPLRDLTKELTDAEMAIRALPPATRAQIDAGLKLGKTIEELGDTYGLTAAQQRVYTATSAEMRREQEEAKKSQQSHNEQMAEGFRAVQNLIRTGPESTAWLKNLKTNVAENVAALRPLPELIAATNKLVRSDAKGARDILNDTKDTAADVTASVREHNRLVVEGLPQLVKVSDLYAEMFQSSLQLTRGLVSAGELLGSRIVTNAARALDYFQRIVGTVHDLVSSIRNISDIGRILSGGGGGGGLGGLVTGGRGLLRLGSGGAAVLPGATAIPTSAITSGGGASAGGGISAGAIGSFALAAAPLLIGGILAAHDIDAKIRAKGGVPLSLDLAKQLGLITAQNKAKYGVNIMGGLKAEQLAHIEQWERTGRLGEIPRFGDGGIVDRPTIAMIGEKGPEAVVPLNRTSNTYGAVTINAPITVIGGANPAEQARAISHHLLTIWERNQGSEGGKGSIPRLRSLVGTA